MKSRPAIAQYEATIVLVVISLSLASVVYDGLRKESALEPEPVFVDQVTLLGGGIERIAVNSSFATTLTSISVDSASSSAGVLAFNGSGYSSISSYCAAGETSFFSVNVSQAGTVEVSTNGLSWVAGTWGGAVSVTPGWQEVIIQGATTCSIALPGGQSVTGAWSPGSSVVSSIPVQGALTGDSFAFYVPVGGGAHSLLITSSGGLEDVAL